MFEKIHIRNFIGRLRNVASAWISRQKNIPTWNDENQFSIFTLELLSSQLKIFTLETKMIYRFSDCVQKTRKYELNDDFRNFVLNGKTKSFIVFSSPGNFFTQTKWMPPAFCVLKPVHGFSLCLISESKILIERKWEKKNQNSLYIYYLID